MLIRSTFILAAVAIGVGAAPAFAEPRWSHPQGVYSIDHAGWNTVAPGGDQLVRFEPQIWTDSELLPVCSVRQLPATQVAGVTQGFINARMMAFTPQQDPSTTVANVTHEAVGGVAVVGFEVAAAERVTMWRLFNIVTNEGVVQHQFRCTAPTPLGDTGRAALAALMSSLRIDNLAGVGAPASARWTSAQGGWSIDYASTGWTFANPIPPEMGNVTLIMLPAVAPPEAEARMCIVTEESYADNGSRAAIRGYGRRYDRARANNGLRMRGQDLTDISYSDRDGVAVVDIRGESNNGARLHRHVAFYAPTGEHRALFVDIDCTWPRTLAPAQVAEIEAILATLQFAPE
jgi:hypothetical protein